MSTTDKMFSREAQRKMVFAVVAAEAIPDPNLGLRVVGAANEVNELQV